MCKVLERMLYVALEFLSHGAIRVLRMSKARQRERVGILLLEESASPFIGEGDVLTSKRESERKRVWVPPSLVAHAVGYKMVCRRPQYC